MERVKRPTTVTAGQLVNLTYETFISVSKRLIYFVFINNFKIFDIF